jgi:hypothetical protein
LDYCASALFKKYGKSKRPNPRLYFPYAKRGEDRKKFREETVERCIPGLLAARPDIVDRLESYQHFGNSGNWLSVFAEITNENKHEELTPKERKQSKFLELKIQFSAGKTEIDLKKIQLGNEAQKPVNAVIGTWTGLVFADTEVMVMFLLETAVPNVRRVVNELAML